MRSSLDALERDIAEMRAMTSAIKPASDLLATSTDPHVKAYLSVRRRFDYSALIVALYASFENFVEDILTSYVEIISKRGIYEALPPKLTRKNLQKTAELLARVEIDQARYPGVTPSQLVENLFRCLSGSSPYELNRFAVSAHEKNLRYDELGKLLGVVELRHDSIGQTKALVDWWHYGDQKSTGAPPSSVPLTVITQRLNNFVERRNDVAHRGGNPSDRLGNEETQNLVEFVFALAHSIFTLFVSHYLTKHHVGTTDCQRLTLVEGPYKKQHVRIVERPPSRLYVAQPAFALSPTFLVRWGRVLNLQMNGVNHASIEPGSTGSVGVLLDFPAPKNAEVYVLGAEDDAVWPALVK